MAAEVVSPGGMEWVQRLELAQTRVGQIRRVLERADRVIARSVNGQDGEGAVEIVLGPGGVTEAVHLDPDWRELVGEPGMAGAVIEAYRAAHGSRLWDWAEAITEELRALGEVPFGRRGTSGDRAEQSALTGPEPDLGPVATDRPDQEVAAEILRALNRLDALSTAAPDDTGTGHEESAGAEPVRGRVGEAFASVSTAVLAAPRWLNLTLVLSGPQHVLGTLRDLTEELLERVAPESRATGAADETVPEAETSGILARSLETAAVRARSMLGIPEGLGTAVVAVAVFVATLHSSAQDSGGSQHASLG